MVSGVLPKERVPTGLIGPVFWWAIHRVRGRMGAAALSSPVMRLQQRTRKGFQMNNRTPCLLCQAIDHGHWPARAKSTGNRGPFVAFDCTRCGTYCLEDKLFEQWTTATQPLEPGISLRLSGQALSAHELGSPLNLTSGNYREIAGQAAVPATYSEYIDRFLLRVAGLCPLPGESVEAVPDRIAAPLFLPTPALVNLAGQLAAETLLQFKPEQPNSTFRFGILPNGWKRVDELQRPGPRGGVPFVAMAFSDELKPIYEQAIKPALVASGYTPPFRVDDVEHEHRFGSDDYTPKIDDRIIAGIRRARFIVVDITDPRPAVLFEAGFAEGLGTPIVWTCREDEWERVKVFDTRQLPHLLWKDAPDLEAKLRARVEARGWLLRGDDER